jgi:hypothetical protein
MTTPSTPSPSGKRQGVPNPTYQVIPRPASRYTSIRDFYPFYLGEHSHPICRRLHLVGTGIATLVLARVGLSLVPRAILLLAKSIREPGTTRWFSDLASTLQPLRLAGPVWRYLVGAIVPAYAAAWIGHFFFEKNRPATFTYPVYSLMGDVTMLWEVVSMQRAP